MSEVVKKCSSILLKILNKIYHNLERRNGFKEYLRDFLIDLKKIRP